MNKEELLKKWEVLIKAAKNYYIDSIPTGLLDSEYDELEKRAIDEDNFSVRNYIFETYLPKGQRAENRDITKFKKEKISSSMFEAIKSYGVDYRYVLKYDGTSLGIYIDPSTGIPKQAITCGNTSLGFGIDQSWKILGFGFLPERFPKGIKTIQCECLIDLDRLPEGTDPERARQAVNGLINGKKETVIEDIKKYLTLRAYRYYCDDSNEGKAISQLDYKDVIKSLPIVYDKEDNHIKFAPADIFTFDDIVKDPKYVETDHTRTSTGYFLNDGYIVYDKSGNVVIGLKYPGAGSDTETLTKTTVQSLQWNNMSKKGKDSFSCNVLVDPIMIHGEKVRKPSAGSVSKLIKNNTTPGAEVTIILANSTIPTIGDTLKPGNGDYQWPVCNCGYKLSEKDIYGSNLKCGNINCTDRINRMEKYVRSLKDITELDLNKLLVIDRVDWGKIAIDLGILLSYVENNDENSYHNYLDQFLNTKLQKANLDLVYHASFIVLRKIYLENVSKK